MRRRHPSAGSTASRRYAFPDAAQRRTNQPVLRILWIHSDCGDAPAVRPIVENRGGPDIDPPVARGSPRGARRLHLPQRPHPRPVRDVAQGVGALLEGPPRGFGRRLLLGGANGLGVHADEENSRGQDRDPECDSRDEDARACFHGRDSFLRSPRLNGTPSNRSVGATLIRLLPWNFSMRRMLARGTDSAAGGGAPGP